MNDDARFEDAGEGALALGAETPEDVEVVSTLLQDAVGQTSDVAWARAHRRFSLLLGRFRWEDRARAEAAGRPYERVRAVLSVDDVLRVRAMGIDPADRDTVFSVLSLAFTPGADGAGTLTIILAGDGAIALDVECINLRLQDVTRPYAAPSGKAPEHDDV
ncbi:MAG: DUF2948 family protein [Pseudomonadota bacterium]